MRALVYEAFSQPPELRTVPDPVPEPHGVVVELRATGVCRSDWHGWRGHDPDIRLPHVPGHELAGVVAAVGRDVRRWRVGDRVTVPFVSGCGSCPECDAGDPQVCAAQFQPGFTHWGSFAEFVGLHWADFNLVALPDEVDFATAASLGCRFATAFRAVVDQGRVRAGEWVAVHGCGGVGLSAVMIASAAQANVVAIDIHEEKLVLAREFGAVATIDARNVGDVARAVREHSAGGAQLSLDALGSTATCRDSIRCLRRRGRHVQVGLLVAEESTPALPMDLVLAHELEILGSHGIQARRYDEIFAKIRAGELRPDRLIGRRISLEEAGPALMDMGSFAAIGATVLTSF